MIPAIVKCWPILRSAPKRVFKHRPIHRIGHATVRHKIVWSCVAVIGGGASLWGLAWPELAQPLYTGMSPPSPGIGNAAGGEYWPPEWGAELPPADVVAGLPLIPVETGPAPTEAQPQSQPIPEPSSLALLLSALAVLIAWRRA